ncbi:DUF397 domain-containing protein [Actinomadura sp. NBRC 104425]|uniref:DUF397 domain-containing protein n=1 Tax=Actinomadura sp. NBRC 104425 TaxID=3032204 RepID=UPI00249FDE87|nr:DUF397 domain-containing protein [Actinomadura sp. NBRC 104425]GLZ14374.1 DUF397 domain-containing protein [Actinomadura sp. NBRC 104425]
MTDSRVSPIVWRKSSYSSDPNLAVCVEVAAVDGARAIRDSKDPDGPRLSMSVEAWRRFIGSIKNDAIEG